MRERKNERLDAYAKAMRRNLKKASQEAKIERAEAELAEGLKELNQIQSQTNQEPIMENQNIPNEVNLEDVKAFVNESSDNVENGVLGEALRAAGMNTTHIGQSQSESADATVETEAEDRCPFTNQTEESTMENQNQTNAQSATEYREAIAVIRAEFPHINVQTAQTIYSLRDTTNPPSQEELVDTIIAQIKMRPMKGTNKNVETIIEVAKKLLTNEGRNTLVERLDAETEEVEESIKSTRGETDESESSWFDTAKTVGIYGLGAAVVGAVGYGIYKLFGTGAAEALDTSSAEAVKEVIESVTGLKG